MKYVVFVVMLAALSALAFAQFPDCIGDFVVQCDEVSCDQDCNGYVNIGQVGFVQCICREDTCEDGEQCIPPLEEPEPIPELGTTGIIALLAVASGIGYVAYKKKK
jgi:hypothetical protein